MTITYLGSLSVGACIPGAMSAIAAALPHLQAQISSLLAFAPSVTPPSFSANLALAQQIVANVELSLSLGLTPPSISAQLSAVAAIVADLQAQLSIILDFQTLMATAGTHLYHYNGTVSGLGGEFTSQLSSGYPGGAAGDTTDALLIGTTSGAAWSAMQGAFKTS